MIRKLILVLSILIWITMCSTASAVDLGIITGGKKYRRSGNFGETNQPMEKNPLLDAIKEIL